MATPTPKAAGEHHEAAVIKRDFFKAAILDFSFLVLLLALYFANRSYGFLDRLIERF